MSLKSQSIESPITILVADDVPVNRTLLRKILLRDGYKVVEAENGIEAIENVERGGIDLALLDIMMPELDGFEVCKRIREKHSLAELPILFLTGKTEEVDVVQGFALGGNDYLTKPLNATILRARLECQIRLLLATRSLKETYQQLAQKKRMETVGMFAAAVAHNFNNLLGTVMGSAELIKHYHKGDPKSQRATELIIKSAERGAQLTSSLLLFSRPTDTEWCENPTQLIRAAVQMVPLMSHAKIAFHINVDAQLAPLNISPKNFSQLVLELLKNAVEAIESDGEVTISAEPLFRSSPSLETSQLAAYRFQLRDSGRGFSDEVKEHAFEPFRSTKNLDSHIGIALDGSGLGLSVAYNIISIAGGQIRISDTGPTGTTIEFDIPVRLPSLQPSETTAHSTAEL